MIRTILLLALTASAPVFAQNQPAAPVAQQPAAAPEALPPLPAQIDPAQAMPEPVGFGPNSTCKTAVRLPATAHRQGVDMEYQWVKTKFPRHYIFERHEISCEGKSTDAFVLFSDYERSAIVMFDSSGYYGKGLSR